MNTEPGVWVIAGTEYERGWGSRPDGYIAFATRDLAETYIAEYDKKFNNKQVVPNEYTKYTLAGFHRCSQQFMTALLASDAKRKHFENSKELLV